MMRLSLIVALTMLASQASASAINWQPHRMGKPMPATAIAGGASGSRVYYVCRKRMPQRWHTGYTFGALSHGSRSQRAAPRSIPNRYARSQQRIAAMAQPQQHGKALADPQRKTTQQPCTLSRHAPRTLWVDRTRGPAGCKAGHNNRSVVMPKYQVLSHPHASNEGKSKTKSVR